MGNRVSSPTLVGRVAEMTRLTARLEAAADGQPSLVLIGGEAGIGKSRLAAELLASARGRGYLVLNGASVSLGASEGLPFGPIAEALRGLVRQVDDETLALLIDPATNELARLVPELAEIAPAPRAGSGLLDWGQTRLFQAFVTLLARLGDLAPVVVLLEDLHWADRSTRDLLAHLVRNLRDERVLILGTYRSDELHRRHPLRPWLAEMQRVRRVESLDLERFDPTQVAAQLEAIIGAPPENSLTRRVVRWSEGNPFFVEELLAAQGQLAEGALPSRLRDLLLARVELLSESAQRLLGVAAVSGRAVDDDLLGTVSGMSGEDMESAVREAISASLLLRLELPQPGYEFRHALVQEAVYDDLLATERRRSHAAYLVALRGRPVPDGAAAAGYWAAVAHHADAALDLAAALPSWIRAAEASMASLAFSEAADAYERALVLWDGLADDVRPSDVDLTELLYAASGALQLAGDARRGTEIARRAVERIDPPADPARAARLRERLAWTTYLAGDLGTGIELLREAAALVEADSPSPDKAMILAGLATFLTYAGTYAEAIPVAERALTIARVAGAPRAEVSALSTLGSCVGIVGDCSGAMTLLREAVTLAQELGEVSLVGTAYLALASTLQDCDALQEAANVGVEAAAWAETMGVSGHDAILAADPMVGLGEWAEAARMYREYLALSTTVSTAQLWCSAWAGLLATWMGSFDDAHRLLGIEDEAGAMLDDVAFAGNLFSALVELALAERRLDDARSKADAGLALLAGSDDIRFRSRLLQQGIRIESEATGLHAARREDEAVDAARKRGLALLATLRSLVEPRLDDPSPVFAEARGNLALGEAEATRLVGEPSPSRWADLAVTFRGRMRPYETAWCRYREAEAILAAKGLRSDAARALSEAHVICLRLGAKPLRASIEELARIARLDLVANTEVTGAQTETNPTVDSPRVPEPGTDFGLTGRERDVLALLVAGYTNHRIADALFISESTASVHVSHILGKLAVTNRVEAAALAVRLNLAG